MRLKKVRLSSVQNKTNTLILFICLNLSFVAVFLFSHSSAQAVPRSELDKVSISVWRIHSETGETYGSAFAGGERGFVTNAHVMLPLLRDGSSKKIYLTQRNGSKRLHFNRLVGISLTYDLAFFEIVESVEDFLRTAVNFNPTQERALYGAGYPHGSWTVVEQIGPINLVNDYTYIVPSNKMNRKGSMRGFSGSPIIDSRGLVVAVMHVFDKNRVYGVKIDYVYDLIDEKIGVRCEYFTSSRRCVQAAMKRVKDMAYDKGHKIAQYQVGSRGYINQSTDINLLTQSARAGFFMAQELVCWLYHNGKRGVQKNRKKARYWCEKVGLWVP